MPRLAIKNHRTGEVLFTGQFETARSCVEQAAADGVCLDEADLRHTNLSHAALDDISLRRARLDHANLTGANISEAKLDGTSFFGATLHAACLCLSNMTGCDFTATLFGATDITGAVLNGSLFTTLSAFGLNFINAESLIDCRYRDPEGIESTFSRPPLTVCGLPVPVILFDEHLKIGNRIDRYHDWFTQTNDNAPPREEDRLVYTFFRKYRPMLRELHEGLRPHMNHFLLHKGEAQTA